MFAILFFDSSNNNTKRKRSVKLARDLAFKFQKKEKKEEAKVKNNDIKFNFIQNNFFETIHKIEGSPSPPFPSNEKFSFSRR